MKVFCLSDVSNRNDRSGSGMPSFNSRGKQACNRIQDRFHRLVHHGNGFRQSIHKKDKAPRSQGPATRLPLQSMEHRSGRSSRIRRRHLLVVRMLQSLPITERGRFPRLQCQTILQTRASGETRDATVLQAKYLPWFQCIQAT